MILLNGLAQCEIVFSGSESACIAERESTNIARGCEGISTIYRNAAQTPAIPAPVLDEQRFCFDVIVT